MSAETTKRPRATAFFDGQNVFHAARRAFGYTFPNYDPLALAAHVCRKRGWQLTEVRFYTGVPQWNIEPFWHEFWMAKLGALGHRRQPDRKVNVVWLPLRYRFEMVQLSETQTAPVRIREEKGVDVRIAIDVIRQADRKDYDVALLFSQDQDLAEVAKEIRAIAREQRRWIKIASAFPVGPGSRSRRGIEGTDWITIDREEYDACIDPKDYRSRAA